MFFWLPHCINRIILETRPNWRVFLCQKKRPQLSGASWGRVGLEMYRMGGNRHGSDVGSLSAVAIKLSVTVACFEITNGLFRPVPLRGVLSVFRASCPNLMWIVS
jgi:hypothetical protein